MYRALFAVRIAIIAAATAFWRAWRCYPELRDRVIKGAYVELHFYLEEDKA